MDLRKDGVPQDAIFKDEVPRTEINEKLEKLKSGSCSKSIRDDLQDDSFTSSEESSRVIYEMGNMALSELRRTTLHKSRSNRIKIVPMQRLLTKNQSKISSFDSFALCCESESLPGQEARRT